MKILAKITWFWMALSLLALPACGGGGAAASPTVDTTPIFTQIASTALAEATEPSPHSTDVAASAVQPDIQALAAGLDNNPLLIYDYLLNNFDTVPMYGLLNNPRETVLSKRGNPFDQAVLLSELLRAAGYETQYVLGIIQLPVAKGMNWVGAETPEIAQQVIDSGGTYCELAGDVLRMKHVWLRVKVAGTWYPLDPSMKSYTYSEGMDLGVILGYNRDAHMAAALSGATVTADYAENLNTANIEARLVQYSTNLAQYLRTNAPFASLSDVVGGRRIVTQTVDSLPTQLPYGVEEELGVFSDLPQDLQYRLHVELSGLDYWTPIPEIAGDRVTITYVGATAADQSAIAAAGGIEHVYPAYTIQMVPQLRIGGVLVATGSPVPLGSEQVVTMTVETPFFVHDARMVWQARPRTLTVGAFYTFPMSLEGVSEQALRRHHGLLEAYRAAGLTEESEPVRGESLYLIGVSYFNQIEACGYLDAALAGVIYVPQFIGAFTHQDLAVTELQSVDGMQQPARVAWGSYGIDVKLGRRTIHSASGDGQEARAFTTQLEQRASAAEHAVLEQLQDNPAISTVRVMELANAAHTRVYRLNSANIEALLPVIECSSAAKDEMRQYVAEGNIVIVPQHRLRFNQWQGTGYWVFEPTSGDMGGMLNGGVTAGIGQALEEPLTMGGSGAVIDEIVAFLLDWLMEMGINVGTGCNDGCNNADPNATNNAGTDPVDTTTGAFLHETTDLAFGTLGYPIQFKRTYVSDRRNANGPLGSGWTHSYAMRLDTSSDWARGLGFRTAMDAVAAIAEAYVDLDLARASVGGLPLERLLVGTAGAHWATAQVIDNVITVTGPDGSHHQYLRLPDGCYQPGHHDYTTLVANADGTYTIVDEAGGRTEFDAQGRATALVDANGNRTSFNYDGQGRLSRVTDAAGRSIDLSYTGALLTKIVDPAERTFQYGYDAKGNLISYTDPLGSVTHYTYDAERRLITLTDPEGIVFTTNTYDAWNRVTRQVDGRSGIMTIAYGDVRSVVTDPLGYRTIYFYDRNQRLVGQADNDGKRASIVYDANDNVLRTISRGGEVKSFAYDADGNLTQITDAIGRSTKLTYDAQQDLIAMRQPSGQTTQMTYDAHHNLVKIVDALGNAVSYTHDGRGLTTGVTNANGHTIGMGYDAQGNIVRVTDALGQATAFTYDALGRALSSQDALGHTTQVAYDADGNLLRRTDPLGNVTAFTYNRNGMPLTVRDGRGNTTRYGYDAGYNLSQVTDATGGVTRYEYDLNQRLVGVTDANGHLTRYERDAMGRIVRITDPLNRSVSLAYNADDWLVGRTRADGRLIRYEYDAVGRLTQTLYPDAHMVARAYDADGHLVSLDDGSWKALYTYDDAGRLTQTALPPQGLTLTYGYDPAGNRLALQAQRAGTLLYDTRWVYDAAERVTSATDAISGYAITYTYNADQTVKTLAHSSGVRVDYTYDAADRATRIDQRDAGDQALSSLDYIYDAAGNPTQVTRATADGSLTAEYTYDALDRLIRESNSGEAIEYTYDAAGNRTRMTGPLGTVNYTYDAADQLLAAGTLTFAYDANGNQVRRSDVRGDYAFAYDDDDRLTQIIAPGGVTTAYRYDPTGRRIGLQGPSGATEFIYDGMSVILEGNAGMIQGTAYLWGRGNLAAARTLGAAGSAMGYLGDRLGSVTHSTDATGSLQSGYSYDAFGQAKTAPQGAVDPYGFVGQLGVRAEPALGDLYLMGLRYYDASMGRFLTQDPLLGEGARPQTLNRYAYALDNPLRYIDPLGLSPWAELSDQEKWKRLEQMFEELRNVDTSHWQQDDFPALLQGQLIVIDPVTGETIHPSERQIPPMPSLGELRDVLQNLVTELQD